MLFQKKLKSFFKNELSRSGGFTLIEMIVAMGLFAIVMFIATGALLTLIAINRKAQAQQVVINNVNFVMESITRNARVGTDYACVQSFGGTWDTDYATPKDCLGGGDVFSFQPPKPVGALPGDPLPPIQVYKHIAINGSATPNSIGVCRLEAGLLCNTDIDFSPLTAPEITVDLLQFTVTGVNYPSQPLFRAIISGHAISNEVKNPHRVDFYIQSGGSQRVLNL